MQLPTRPAASLSFRRPGEHPTPVSSRIIARSWNSASSTPPCTRSMNAWPRPISWRSPPYTGGFLIVISIIHPDAIEPVRRSYRTTGIAVARRQWAREIVRAPSAFADLDERTHHRPHLVMQKRARRCVDAHLVAVPFHIQPVERLHRRFRLTLGGPERGEVVPSDKALSGLVHGRYVEWPRRPPGASDLQAEIGPAIDDPVDVMALARRKPRVEVVRDVFGCQHRNRVRAQMGIDGVADGVGVPGLGEVDMRHLAERVHARIRASRPLHVNALAAECRHRRRQDALDRYAIVLHLPADERGAVIFDQQLVAWHAWWFSSQSRTSANRRAAQEFLGRHTPAARALQFEDAHRPVPAPDGERIVDHGARRGGSFAPGGAQNLDAGCHSAGARHLEPPTRERPQPPPIPLPALPRPLPLHPGFFPLAPPP